MTDECARDTALTNFACLALLGLGLLAFSLGRRFCNWVWFGRVNLPNVSEEKTLLYAFTKRELRKVRISFQREVANGEITAFSVDMEPTAAIEFADSIRVSARDIANLELVEN